MALTADGAQLTEAHRRGQVAVRGLAVRDLAQIVPLIDPDDIAGTWSGVERAIAAVVQQRRDQSSALSAAYFSRFRAIEAGGAFTARTVGPLDPAYLLGRLRFAGPGQVGRLLATNPTQLQPLLFTSLQGEVSRQVLNGGRETIDTNVEADRTCIGWVRVTDGDPCAFCAMLASRGPVYKSRETAQGGRNTERITGPQLVNVPYSERVGGYRAHNHCGCTAEPVYSTDTDWPGRSREFHELWQDSTKGFSGKDALNAFRRALGKT